MTDERTLHRLIARLRTHVAELERDGEPIGATAVTTAPPPESRTQALRSKVTADDSVVQLRPHATTIPTTGRLRERHGWRKRAPLRRTGSASAAVGCETEFDREG